MLKEFYKRLELNSWDNWLPLLIIGIFALAAVLVGTGITNFNIPFGDEERVHILYTEVSVQTTAGIFAIIVTLSLVAIQFASQEYTHRIMDSYVKSIMFWSTIIVYLGVMVTGIVLQANATEEENVRLIGVTVIGSILTLALLVPHFVITAAYLKPEFIINKMLRRVDRQYLASVAPALERGQGRVDSKVDRLLPVAEIIQRAIDRGDLATTRGALERLHQTYLTHAEKLNLLSIERYFLDYLMRIGRKAISDKDEEEAAVQTIAIMGVVGCTGPAGLVAVENIDSLGFTALRQESEPVVHQMIDSLRTVFDSTPTQEARNAVLASYQDLVGRLASSQSERVLRHLVTTLTNLAEKAMASGDRKTSARCLDLLEAAGHDAAAHKIVGVVLQTTRSLQGIGVTAARADPATAEPIVRALLRMERAISPSERELIAATEFARQDIERVARFARSAFVSPGAGASVAATTGPASGGLPAREREGPSPPGQEQKDGKETAPETKGEEKGIDLSDLW
ncbi:MAG: hypothetical protein HY532_09735 [Chloroflexi bacterium]|nr:hypothetical protein [Chloroflexota bacterium]